MPRKSSDRAAEGSRIVCDRAEVKEAEYGIGARVVGRCAA